MSNITGGVPAGNKIVALNDVDMKEVERLASLGPNLTEDDINAHTRRIASARGMATRGHQYEQYMDRVKWAMASGDTRVRGEWDRANKGIVALRNKDIAPGAVHQNATLANMSVQYANEMYIGEELLPTFQVAKDSDVYYTYGQRDPLA